MPSTLWFLFFCCVAQQSISSFVGEIKSIQSCVGKSSLKGHRLLVRHEKPSPSNGKVLITATVLPSIGNVSTCRWILKVGNSHPVQQRCNLSIHILKGTTLKRKFREAGLKNITAIVNFFIYVNRETHPHSLYNCTFVNVTDCSRQLNLAVSSSKTSFNVSRNHSKLTLDAPGMVNFSMLVYNVKDPFHICRPLSYKWSFGDGQYLSGTVNHTSHFYNSSGLYFMVVHIFDSKNERELYKNISLTIHVKVKNSNDSTVSTALNVTLILVICVAVIILVVCFVVFRKKVHRFTEVARFDFRHKDFPSVDTTAYYKQKGCCSKMFPRKENQCLIDDDDDPFSSRMSFGSALPTEEL